jgi:hypothetical protein
MKFSIVIILMLTGVYGYAQEQKQIENEAYIIKQHSFDVHFENMGHVKFISYHDVKKSPPKVDFFLVNPSNHILYTFPTYYGNEHWAFYSMKAVSFKDMNRDGLKDVMMITEHVTGIGPSGAEPFVAAGFYLQGEKGFTRYRTLEEKVNSEPLYGTWKSISDLVAIAASLQKSPGQ